MRGMKHIPVDREAGADSYRAAVEALRAGELVGVFPEATISQSFELKQFKSGAVRMAQEAGVPLIPSVIWGSQRLWTKNRPRSATRRGVEIRVVVGEPYVPEGDPAAATEELKRRMQALLEEARSTYGGKPAAPDDTWWLPAAEGGTAPTLEQAEEADTKEREERAARRAAREAAGDN
jgi:1-acyl-sn-glycerol-3-phosphate acyltransferase